MPPYKLAMYRVVRVTIISITTRDTLYVDINLKIFYTASHWDHCCNCQNAKRRHWLVKVISVLLHLPIRIVPVIGISPS